MPTREVPREEWPSFFDDFSQEHLDWPTTIELVGDDIGDQPEADNEPLVGISVDLKGSAKRPTEVMVGARPDDNLTHTISSPTRVWSRDAGEATQQTVETESAAGPKTLI